MADTFDPTQVHIWYFAWDAAPPASFAQALYAWLSPDERQRLERFRFERDRDAYLFAHALVRRLLASYCGAPEESWRFDTNEYGRPFVATPRCDLQFNLTHTAGMVACAISMQPEIGVDAERVDRTCEFLSLARRYFAPPEVRSLDGASDSGLAERFFTIWTLKEAYIKARGMGLSLPLHDFEVRAEQSGAARISFLREANANGSDWHLRVFLPTPSHFLSAAVRMSQPPVFLFRDATGLLARRGDQPR